MHSCMRPAELLRSGLEFSSFSHATTVPTDDDMTCRIHSIKRNSYLGTNWQYQVRKYFVRKYVRKYFVRKYFVKKVRKYFVRKLESTSISRPAAQLARIKILVACAPGLAFRK